MQKGTGIEDLDELREELKQQAANEFDRFIRDKNNRSDAKSLIIEAYEGVLYDKRKVEKEVLNQKRFKEYEKNRPP